MLHKHAYTAVQVSDWEKAVIEVTGNEHAGQMLREWFSRKTRPVLQLTVSPKSVQFEQMTDDVWTVPVEIAGSSGVHLAAFARGNRLLSGNAACCSDYAISRTVEIACTWVVRDTCEKIRLFNTVATTAGV
ncbi:unnamed protein product [Nippostrongylus brasiliensis]|uniref:Matrix non-peptidase homolog 1 (inferred by orthology to a C. elegans protein) n=1 Tax=Nippostrongylus brasiliensis TaxID=27835 RepID=A0A0N4YYH4_NIPBR|nr:unnamed protein product [Nippostrongylus brasiliensis]